MSEVDTAVDGAEAATLPDEKPVAPASAQDTQEQESATADVDQAKKDGPPRDDKGRFVPQERVNEITRARREEERRRIAAEQRNQELESQLAQLRQPQATAPKEAPTLEQFDYDQNRWAAAMMEYAVNKASSTVEERLKAQEAQRAREKAVSGFEERSREYEAANPGYSDRLSALDAAVKFPQEVVEAIATSEQGPAMADYLASHLDEADRISRLPTHIAAVEIGRLESKVSAPKPKPVTNTPNPVPTLSGGSSVAGKDLSRMSYADYKAARMKGQ